MSPWTGFDDIHNREWRFCLIEFTGVMVTKAAQSTFHFIKWNHLNDVNIIHSWSFLTHYSFSWTHIECICPELSLRGFLLCFFSFVWLLFSCIKYSLDKVRPGKILSILKQAVAVSQVGLKVASFLALLPSVWFCSAASWLMSLNHFKHLSFLLRNTK